MQKVDRHIGFVLILILLMTLFGHGLVLSESKEGLVHDPRLIDFESMTEDELHEIITRANSEIRSRLVTKIVLDEDEIKLAKGKSKSIHATIIDVPEDIKAGKLIWESGNSAVVSCQNGQLKANSAGETTVKCSCFLSDGTEIYSECRVTVYIAVSSISVPQRSINVYKGNSATQEVRVKPDNATDKSCLFESSDTAVVAIADNGDLRAVGVGKATITVSAKDGSGAKTTYTVSVPNLNLDKLIPTSLLRFGHYPQNSDGQDNTPIEWIVLEIADNKAYLLSKNILSLRPYHNNDNGAIWNNCDLRKWLNNDFYKQAFTNDEQKALARVGSDRVTLLSQDEAMLFFDNRGNSSGKSPGLRRYIHARCSDYAASQRFKELTPQDQKELKSAGSIELGWWSCTVDEDERSQVYYHGDPENDGLVFATSYCSNSKIGVRPLICVDLKKG